MTPDKPTRLCTAIRGVIRADYDSLPTGKGYRHLGDIWGLSSSTAWRFINVKNYYPTSRRIREVLRKKARERGIEIKRRIRVELDSEIGEEDLKVIREMSVKDRTEVLINFIKGDKR